MAKKSIIERNKKRLNKVQKYFYLRNLLKQKILSSKSLEEKFEYYEKLQQLPKDSCRVRIRNRCWITGRSRGVFKNFGLSRHFFRDLSSNGFLPGIVKSSW
uniref:Small ribosomal subunit protein uS14c n=1 Tax=Cyanidium sp. THAL103 TaxID=3027999 RepID=A0A9Y1MY80_9RHOD|nr:ribosomal protein S14 [Cyanidium sp. THAL103]